MLTIRLAVAHDLYNPHTKRMKRSYLILNVRYKYGPISVYADRPVVRYRVSKCRNASRSLVHCTGNRKLHYIRNLSLFLDVFFAHNNLRNAEKLFQFPAITSANYFPSAYRFEIEMSNNGDRGDNFEALRRHVRNDHRLILMIYAVLRVMREVT